jgi:hypothetical protein
MRLANSYVLATALLAAGCSTMPSDKPFTPERFKPDLSCKPGAECATWVNPLNDWVPGKIVMEEGSGSRIVVWKSFWVFENGGIKFDKGREAMGCEQRNPWMVMCTANAKGEFKYTIDVLGYPPADPWFVNH